MNIMNSNNWVFTYRKIILIEKKIFLPLLANNK